MTGTLQNKRLIIPNSACGHEHPTHLNKVDTIPVDTTLAAEDLRKITVEEMINFTKHYDELFVNYIRKKYKVENGYVIKIE